MFMRRLILIYGLILILIGGILYSCEKKEEYPIIPKIKFENFLKIYNPDLGIFERGVLKISFTDGDGDIGLYQWDTVAPYDYNFFITYYEIQNGDTVEVFITKYNEQTGEDDTLNFHARIPILTPGGSNKSIKGEIEDTLFIYNYNSSFDTIMYKAYIKDRALHESNSILTPLIVRR